VLMRVDVSEMAIVDACRSSFSMGNGSVGSVGNGVASNNIASIPYLTSAESEVYTCNICTSHGDVAKVSPGTSPPPPPLGAGTPETAQTMEGHEVHIGRPVVCSLSDREFGNMAGDGEIQTTGG
jgi:hypothetical protein